MRYVMLVTLAVLSGACANDIVTASLDPSFLTISGLPEEVPFDSAAVGYVTVTDGTGKRIQTPMVEWSSSDPGIISVEPGGRIKAEGLGAAVIRARAGSARDSVRIRVSNDGCNLGGMYHVPNNIRLGVVTSGGIREWHEPINYRNTPVLNNASLVFGTTPSTTFVSRSVRDGVCHRLDNGRFHAVAIVEEAMTTSPGLYIVQHVLAYTADNLDDFVLFRYDFTNKGAEAISGLRVGMRAFINPIYYNNVKSFSVEHGAATAVAPDSIANPVVAGILIASDPVASYRAFPFFPFMTNADAFSYLSGGIQSPLSTGPVQHEQMIGAAAIDLAPGETRSYWFAITAGDNRAEFDRNAQAARAMVEVLRSRSQ